MNLDFFNNLVNDVKSNSFTLQFINELTKYLNNTKENIADKQIMQKNDIEKYRKEDNFVDLEALQKMPADLSPFSFETFKASNSKFQSEEDAIAFIENGFRRFDIERFL